MAEENLVSPEEAIPWSDIPKIIWHFLEGDRARFAAWSTVLFLIFFYGLAPAYIMGRLVDFFTHYKPGDSLRLFYLYAGILGGSYVVVSLIRLHAKNVLRKIAVAARVRARVHGFEHLIQLSLEWHAEENTGNKIQRIFTGSQALYQWIQTTNKDVFRILALFIGILTFFLIKSFTFFLFLILYILVFFSIEYIFNQKISVLSAKVDAAKEAEGGIYTEGTENMLAIQALGASQDVRKRIKDAEEHTEGLEFQLSDAASRKWYWFQSINGITYGAFLFIVGYLFIMGKTTLGSLVIFYGYFNSLRDAANDSSDLGLDLVGLRTDMARMITIFKENSRVKTGQEPFPRRWKEIRLKDASFHYPTGQAGIEHFNFYLKQGEKLGIAGASGSGKSTLVKILLGLYPIEKGEFSIDGKSYYSISHEELTKHIAIVLQETELFNLSLKDNITLGHEFNHAHFDRAIRIADLEDVVRRLPGGIDALVGERGYSLSGGERQRLGIARAVYKNAPVLILDEATSSLDGETEQKVMGRLFQELGSTKTFLIIAHRLSTLKDVDRVIVLDGGTIAEEGHFGTLVGNSSSRFGKLYALQRKGESI